MGKGKKYLKVRVCTLGEAERAVIGALTIANLTFKFHGANSDASRRYSYARQVIFQTASSRAELLPGR